jgi:hypothetical protein
MCIVPRMPLLLKGRQQLLITEPYLVTSYLNCNSNPILSQRSESAIMPFPTDEVLMQTAKDLVAQLQGIFGSHPGFRPGQMIPSELIE